MQPLLLAIETATRCASVALLRGEELMAELRGEAGGAAAETLLPAIDRMLRAHAVAPRDLRAFAVSIGPGSFTGLRVGIATLKGLAFGGDAEVARVPTLAALACTAPRRDLPVAALLDARRGEAYAAVYELTEGEPLPRVEEGVYGLDALVERIPRDCVLVGEGAPLFGPELRLRCGDGIEIAAGEASAAAVGRLGARMLARGEGVAAGAVVPRYVRRAEAEVKRTGEAFEPAPARD